MYMCICVYKFMYACICVSVYVYMSVFVYVYMYIFSSLFIRRNLIKFATVASVRPLEGRWAGGIIMNH